MPTHHAIPPPPARPGLANAPRPGPALALAPGRRALPAAHAVDITVDGTTCTLTDAILAANTDTAF